MAGRWDTIAVDGSEMRCYVTAPAGAGPFPAVVVIQHAGGVDAFIQSMADRLTDEGFATIAPDLYHREDPNSSDNALVRMGRLRDINVVVDANAAIAHVAAQPNVAGGRVGITGFCMGGRVAILMAAHNPALRAVVAFYPGNLMVPWGDGPAPLDIADKIEAPVMALFGADDGNPNPADVKKIDAELTRLGKAHDFHSYAGAGHAFMSEGRPSYQQAAAEDAWPKCVAWFQRHLA